MQRAKSKKVRARNLIAATAVRPSTQTWLSHVFHRSEYQVEPLDPTGDVVHQVNQVAPDLVILDLLMPGMSGLDVLRELKLQGSHVPVIVVTAKITPSQARKIVDLGAADYVVKPTDEAVLLARLKRLLRLSGVELEERKEDRSTIHHNLLKVVLPELHDATTGRLDAQKIAGYLGVPLSKLAEALGANYTSIHKTPSADSLQEKLIPIKRSLEILSQVLGDRSDIRTWLNSPHPDLGLRSPIQIILAGQAGAVRTILENAIVGIST